MATDPHEGSVPNANGADEKPANNSIICKSPDSYTKTQRDANENPAKSTLLGGSIQVPR
jgi:hypothetical protein